MRVDVRARGEVRQREALEGRVLPAAGYTVAERLVVEAAVPELKPRVREIVQAARDILDEQGADALSMRAIAARLGVRAPSLYKHLPDKRAILDVLVADLLREHGDVLRAAIDGAEDPVGAIFTAFRGWVLAHPQRYALATGSALSSNPMVTAASLYAGDPLRWVMRDDLEGAVVFWAFAHGLIDLEIRGRFAVPYEPEPIWAWGVARLRHPEDPVPPEEPFDDARAHRDFRAIAPEDQPLTARGARIVVAARELLEEEGEEAMSMRRIAARLGVRAPSLYKHVPDKQALENAIIASVLDDQAELARDVMAAARAAGRDPLVPMVESYRRWALDHPELYRLNVRGPLDRGGLVRSAELRGSAAVHEASGGHGRTSMTLWAFTHGLIDLEMKGRMPPGYAPEAIHRRGIAALRAVPPIEEGP